MSAKNSSRNNTVNGVTLRVKETKKEIEELKAELEKLINNGVKQTKSSTNAKEIEDSNSNATSSRIVSNNVIRSRSRSRSTVLSPKKRKTPPKALPKPEEASPKKVRNYNPEEARDFIRKQKEKRLEKQKMQVKDTRNVVVERKERLKELHQRTLKLVTKNVQLKRERSQSREKSEVPECLASSKENVKSQEQLVPAVITPGNNFAPVRVGMQQMNKKIDMLTSVQKVGFKNRKVMQAHPNITQRAQEEAVEEEALSTPKLPAPIDSDTYKIDELKRSKCATKIQAVYRGYRQRKLFRLAVKMKRKLEAEAARLAEEAVARNQKQEKPQTNECKASIPEWLQGSSSNPYNFINTVKRKLNLAVNSVPKTSSDVAIQSSFQEENTMTKQEIRELLENSIKSSRSYEFKSFLSHKCLDVKLKEPQGALSRHSKNKSSSSHSRDDSDKYTTDSDTSKNIPDLSSESNSISRRKADVLESALHFNSDKIKKMNLLRKRKSIEDDEDSLICLQKAPETSHNRKKLAKASEKTEVSHREAKSNSSIQEIDRSKIKSNTSIEEADSGQHSKPKSNSSLQEVDDSHRSKTKSISSIQEVASVHQLKIKSNSSLKEVDGAKSKSSIQEFEHSSSSGAISGNDSIVASNRSKYNTYKSKSRSSSNISTDEIPKTASDSNVTHREAAPEPLKSFLEYMAVIDNTPKKPQSNSNSEEFRSLPTETVTSRVVAVKSAADKYSSDFTDSNSNTLSSVPSLKRPSISLQTSQVYKISGPQGLNISLKQGEKTAIETTTNSNQIHLKFEAELHLLNDFNESLRQFMAVEKSLIELQNKNSQNTTLHQHTRDTQTSLASKSISQVKSNDSEIVTEGPQSSEKHISSIKSVTIPNQSTIAEDYTSQKQISSINYSRGDDFSLLELKTSMNDSSLNTGLELTQLGETIEPSVKSNEISGIDGHMYAGLSLGMFDQFIKDEDARLENLKTILKIREKSLLDRTKGELAWLEVQKKHLKETGQLHEVSLVKKKQRGILIKLQHEKHEMQRLKQMQKAASKERKTILKEQRNLIKAQLSTTNMITKIKRQAPRERRQSGPFKVYNVQTHREVVTSETSLSKRSSVTEEIVNITSRSQSVVSAITDGAPSASESHRHERNVTIRSQTSHNSDHIKRSLLMREAALQRRRKAAEELLQWHQRLLEEEKKIAELEMAANSVINQFSGQPTDPSSAQEKYKLKGEQLNLLWQNMTSRNEKKFNDSEVYSVSQIALERFCKDAKKYAKEKSTQSSKKSETSNESEILSENASNKSTSLVDEIKTQEFNYSTEFETVKTTTQNESTVATISEEKTVLKQPTSSLSEIIRNISDITHEISAIHELSSINTITEKIKESSSAENHISTDEKASKIEAPLSKSLELQISEQESSHNKTRSTSEIPSEVIKSPSTQSVSKLTKDNDSQISSEKLILKASKISKHKSISTESKRKISDKESSATSAAVSSELFEVASSTTTSSKSNQHKDASVKTTSTSSKTSKLSKTSNQNASAKSKSTSRSRISHERKVGINETKTSSEVDSKLSQLELSKEFSDQSVSKVSIDEESWETTKPSDDKISSEISSKHVESSKESSTQSKTLLSEPKISIDEEINSKLSQVELSKESSPQLQTQTSEPKVLIDEESWETKISEDKISSEINSKLSHVQFKTQTSEPKALIDEESWETNTSEINSKLSHVESLLKSETQLSEPKASNDEASWESETSEDKICNEILSKLTKAKESSVQLKPPKPNESIDEESWGTKTSDDDMSHAELSKESSPQSDILKKKSASNTSINSIKTLTEQVSSHETINSDKIAISKEDNLSSSSKSSFKSSVSEVGASQQPSEIDENQKSSSKRFGNDASNDSANKSKSAPEISASQVLMNSEIDKIKSNDDDLSVASKSSVSEVLINSETDYNNVTISNEEHLSAASKGHEEASKVLPEDASENRDFISSDKDIDDESSLVLEEGAAIENAQSKEDLIADENEEESDKDNISTKESLYDKEALPTEAKSDETASNTPKAASKSAELEINIMPDSEKEMHSEILVEAENDLHSEISVPEREIEAASVGSGTEEESRISEKLSLSYGFVKKRPEERASDDTESSNSENELPEEEAEKMPEDEPHIDVKKRVSEILADAHSVSRSEKSPRLQDLYCTTYDLNSPEHSPDTGSPIEPLNKEILSAKFGDEAEELLKKQLAIEQEIKQLEQQQKEQIPYLYVREIPNKPPPPYTPPSSQSLQTPMSVLPTNAEEVDLIVENVSDILYDAHVSNQLPSVFCTDENMKDLADQNITKMCYELVFDLSKEIALEYYSQFKSEPGPAWLKMNKKPRFFIKKQLDKEGLGRLLKKKINQVLGFEHVESKQSTIVKWSHKKRDHVDELLILESQTEEAQWTNYDYDELVVKNEVASDLMNLLISETADVVGKILAKKTFLY